MLLAVDRQQNYFYVMEDNVDKVREFVIKYKGKPCEFNKTINGGESGRVVGYNKRNGLIIVKTDNNIGWNIIDEGEDIFVYKRFKLDKHSFYYVSIYNIVINEQNVPKLSSKTSKRK